MLPLHYLAVPVIEAEVVKSIDALQSYFSVKIIIFFDQGLFVLLLLLVYIAKQRYLN